MANEKEGFENITSETAKELDDNREIENLKKVEAAMFLSARFLSLQELVLLTDINPLMLRELVQKLIEKYNQEDSAIEIISKEDMWKMDVRQEYVHMVNKLATGSSEFSKAEQETLAVIAYKQPVKQSVIIKIRGNKAYEHIKHFRDIGLIFAKKVGHTLELKLSDDFFDYFHLVNRNAINDEHPNSNKNQKEFGGFQNKNGKEIDAENIENNESEEENSEDEEENSEDEEEEIKTN